MAAELGLLSITQLQKLAQQQQQHLNPGNWNSTDDGLWEVRAFAKDTGSTTWPPRRTYSCSFCHREFRSAQALGGHMNVHRRDRAMLRQGTGPSSSSSATSAPSITFSSLEFDAGGGLCLFYPIPSAGVPCSAMAAPNQGSPALNLLAGMGGSIGRKGDVIDYNLDDGMVVDELDLELRL